MKSTPKYKEEYFITSCRTAVNILVVVDGRPALPIRAIPLTTDWEVLSPDVCANAFAGDEHSAPNLENMPTYRLLPDGSYESIHPRVWSNLVVPRLEALSDGIKVAGFGKGAAYSEWRVKSIELLPEAAFVWLDDFERAYAAEYGPESLRWKFGQQEYEPSVYDLNYQPSDGPFDGWEGLVMMGFTKASKSVADAENKNYVNSKISQDGKIEVAHQYQSEIMKLDKKRELNENITPLEINNYHKSKLSENQKEEIIYLFRAKRIPIAELARRFSVSRPVIYKILKQDEMLIKAVPMQR